MAIINMKKVLYIFFIFTILIFLFKIPLLNFILNINPLVVEYRDLTPKEFNLIKKSKEIINILNLIVLIYSIIILSISLFKYHRNRFSSKLNNVVLIISIFYILFYTIAYSFKIGLWQNFLTQDIQNIFIIRNSKNSLSTNNFLPICPLDTLISITMS